MLSQILELDSDDFAFCSCGHRQTIGGASVELGYLFHEEHRDLFGMLIGR